MPFPVTATFPAVAEFAITVFLFDGDSLSLGSGATVPLASYIHTLVSGASNYAGKGRFENVAVGGRTVPQMTAAFNQTKQFVTWPRNGFLFLWGGTVGTGNATFTDLQAYWALARADGWKVVAFTILPRSGDTAPLIAEKLAHNTSIRAASANWDYLADIAAVAALSNPNDPAYYSDLVHLTTLGYQTVADTINSTINLPVL